MALIHERSLHGRSQTGWLVGITLWAATLSMLSMPAMGCGERSDCAVGERIYRIYLPDQPNDNTRIGAIIFAHGHGGSAAQIIDNVALKEVASALGVALIAPQAALSDWSLPHGPVDQDETIDELTYFDALIAVVAERFAIDQDQLLMAGFSDGSMLVWHLACYRGDRFAGFVAMSGTFWAPLPTRCPSQAVNLFHYHGTADRVVPAHGGRAIENARQGDVYQALALFAEQGDFGPATQTQDGKLRCQQRRNPSGQLQAFCLHPGGHVFSVNYLTRAWQQIEALNNN